MLDHQDVNERWCLIHATHLTDHERKGIANSGAVVGLCPITEANLGDGLFPAVEYLKEQGSIGIGSDSNVEITAAGELRLLEYGQRLSHGARNVLAGGEGSTGAALYGACRRGGSQALAAPDAALAVGAPGDLLGYKDSVALPPADDQTLDRWIFAKDIRASDVWAAGQHLVSNHRHHNRGAVEAAYRKAMQRIMAS